MTSSEQGFYVKKRQKDKAAFLNPFPQRRVPEVQSVAEQTCSGCPSLPVWEASLRPLLPVTAWVAAGGGCARRSDDWSLKYLAETLQNLSTQKRCFCKISPELRSCAEAREVGAHPCGDGGPLGPGQNPVQSCCIRSCRDAITTCVGFFVCL